MPVVHFLNVDPGDCSIIQHGSGRVTVIDVCEARAENAERHERGVQDVARAAHHQKDHTVNPIGYMRRHGINSVFRIIVTHPDMDHLDGLSDFFDAYPPTNFYDTDNNKTLGTFPPGGRFREQDWALYRGLRDEKPTDNPKRSTLYAGRRGKYYNRNGDGTGSGDALYFLAPTPELVAEANRTGDFNDCSYVVLYHGPHGRVLFSGDAHDKTWAHILEHHKSDVQNVDLLIAPHHGRKSARTYDFLDVVRPKMTFFGNAPSEHLAYGAWSHRSLPYVTSNRGGSLVVDVGVPGLPMYASSEHFARSRNASTSWSPKYLGFFVNYIRPGEAK